MEVQDKNRWVTFERRYTQAHFTFACHAAIPRIFTTDLLYKVWLNFQKNTKNEPLHIPLIAIAELINSPIVNQLGQDLFEFYPEIRIHLSKCLLEAPGFGIKRKQELALFVNDYVKYNLDKLPSKVVEQALLLEAQTVLDPITTINDLVKGIQQTLEEEEVNMSKIRQSLNFIESQKRTVPDGSTSNIWEDTEDLV
ncbi:MAG: hypothetical protein AAFY76_00205, partial [Cyanobacteria bacterium J06649_11]